LLPKCIPSPKCDSMAAQTIEYAPIATLSPSLMPLVESPSIITPRSNVTPFPKCTRDALRRFTLGAMNTGLGRPCKRSVLKRPRSIQLRRRSMTASIKDTGIRRSISYLRPLSRLRTRSNLLQISILTLAEAGRDGVGLLPVLVDLDASSKLFSHRLISSDQIAHPKYSDSNKQTQTQNRVGKQLLGIAGKLSVISAKTCVDVCQAADFVASEVNILDVSAMHRG